LFWTIFTSIQMAGVHSFHSLPDCFLLLFLQEWLSLTENCKLNSALCNTNTRPSLTNVIEIFCEHVPANDLIGLVTLMECVQLTIMSPLNCAFNFTGIFIIYELGDLHSNCPLQVWKFIDEHVTSGTSHFNVITGSTSLSQLEIKPQVSESQGIRYMTFWNQRRTTPSTLVIQHIHHLSCKIYKFGAISNEKFRRNKEQNTGVLFTKSKRRIHIKEKLCYSGGWGTNGCEGFGVCTYSDGSVYKGNWSGSLENGFGVKMTWDDDIYSGAWKFGFEYGYGILSCNSEKYAYKGYWEEGAMCDWGVFMWSTCETLRGHWNGAFTTKGNQTAELRLHNGDKFTGQFRDGFIHGTGSVLFNNGDMFEGDFVEKQLSFWDLIHSSDCHLPARRGEWFCLLDYMLGTFTKVGSRNPVWNKWKPPQQTGTGGEWSMEPMPF
jgi:hypothetical protein